MPRPATVVPVGVRNVTMAAVSFRYLHDDLLVVSNISLKV